MSDVKVEAQYGVAPTPAAVSTNDYVQDTPVWMVVIRGVQVVLALAIVGMCGWLMHGKVLDAQAFGLVCGIFTWIIVGYTLITEKVSGARGAYNIWAVMSLDLFMAIFWLASLGTNAHTRSKFTARVTVTGCSSNGQAFNSKHCTVVKRDGTENAVAGDGALSIMSAIAGVSALLWLLFVATLVYHGHTFRLWHQANKKPSADNANVELDAQGAPMLGTQQQAVVAPQYTGPQQQYQQQYYPQQQHQQPQHPQAQQPAYPQAAEVPGNYQQYQQQVPYVPTPVATPAPQVYPQQTGTPQPYGYQASPVGTPAPGQPYYPPQQ